MSLGWELFDDEFCPKYCRQCGPEPDKKCKECAPGYKIYDENENPIPIPVIQKARVKKQKWIN